MSFTSIQAICSFDGIGQSERKKTRGSFGSTENLHFHASKAKTYRKIVLFRLMLKQNIHSKQESHIQNCKGRFVQWEQNSALAWQFGAAACEYLGEHMNGRCTLYLSQVVRTTVFRIGLSEVITNAVFSLHTFCICKIWSSILIVWSLGLKNLACFELYFAKVEQDGRGWKK